MNHDDVGRLVSEGVRAVCRRGGGVSEKAWQVALLAALGGRSKVEREVHLGGQIGLTGSDWRVFGRGRAADFVVEGVPLELKLLGVALAPRGHLWLEVHGQVGHAAAQPGGAEASALAREREPLPERDLPRGLALAVEQVGADVRPAEVPEQLDRRLLGAVLHAPGATGGSQGSPPGFLVKIGPSVVR